MSNLAQRLDPFAGWQWRQTWVPGQTAAQTWMGIARAQQQAFKLHQRQREQDQAEEQSRRLEERWHRLCRRYDSKHSRGGG